jgi:hypothetical protein
MDEISSYIKWRYHKMHCTLKTDLEDSVKSVN